MYETEERPYLPKKESLIHTMACFTDQLGKDQLYSINRLGTIGSPYGKMFNLEPYIISPNKFCYTEVLKVKTTATATKQACSQREQNVKILVTLTRAVTISCQDTAVPPNLSAWLHSGLHPPVLCSAERSDLSKL